MRIPGFYRLTIEERLRIIKKFANLSVKEIDLLRKTGALELNYANRMIENVIGTTELPLGIATNFLINGKDYLIPMAIEEPSVVAAASYAAKLARENGGFVANATEPIMIGQIQVVNVENLEEAKKNIMKNERDIINIANKQDPLLIKLGGGVVGIESKGLKTKRGNMLIIHLLVNVRDAMGANVVNTMSEAVAPLIEEITGGRVRLRIVSNLTDKRIVKAKAVWSRRLLGDDLIEGILDAYHFAKEDKYRCTTHNKGIMNGIDAVLIATGNDFRAVEAGAHSYAVKGGRYEPLTKYYKNKDGDLVGEIEIPIAVGIVGGATRTHPIAKISLKLLGVKTAKELSEVIASVGLAQNFAALRALVSEGIQRGHMELHATNIAILAGAKGKLIDKVAEIMVKERCINVQRAKEILEEMN